jgi:serine/threonine protein kinase
MTWLSNDVVTHLREVATWPELPSDRYVLRRPIGRGGMGTVYLATDDLLQREVAVKVSNSPVSTGDLEARLRQEARVLARLEHPGIVPVHDAGVLEDGRLFYVMKRVRGDTLAASAEALTVEARALSVFERVVDAVAFAHARGVVHRDLKPSNVMLGSFGEVLVLDWGVARLVREAAEDDGPDRGDGKPPTPIATDRTDAGTRLGTPGFMPPEQARGDASAAGPAADVYSLGALLYWMLTREAPGEAAETNARRLQSLTPRPPKRLRALIVKCLAPDPSARYPDAGALAADLERYRAGQSVSAHRETTLDLVGRWYQSYRGAILLVAAYLVMRTLFALWTR